MKQLLFLISMFLLTSCGVSTWLADGNTFLVDLRTSEEFVQGSAQGAVNIPIEEVDARINEFKGHEKIIIFCRTGNKSGKTYKKLKEAGFTNVKDGHTYLDVISKQEKR